jgi:hypothetical protein
MAPDECRNYLRGVAAGPHPNPQSPYASIGRQRAQRPLGDAQQGPLSLTRIGRTDLSPVQTDLAADRSHR